MRRSPEQTEAEAVSAAAPRARRRKFCRNDPGGKAATTTELDARARPLWMNPGSRHASAATASTLTGLTLLAFVRPAAAQQDLRSVVCVASELESLAGSGPVRRRSEDPSRDAALRATSSLLDPPVPAEELCSGQAPGASCWMELADEAGCFLWNPSLQARETVTWTGRCSAGYAQGLGQVRWLADGSTQTEEGRLVDGQRDGIWVTQDQDEWASQGSHARGQRHGTSVWCRFGRPRNVSQVAIYEYGILLRSYASYHEIDDERLADEAERICARLLPSGQLPHPGATNTSDFGPERAWR